MALSANKKGNQLGPPLPSAPRGYTSWGSKPRAHTPPSNSLWTLRAPARLRRGCAQQADTVHARRPRAPGTGLGPRGTATRGGARGRGGGGCARPRGTFSRSSRMRCSCVRRASQPCRTYAGDTSLSPAEKLSWFMPVVVTAAGARETRDVHTAPPGRRSPPGRYGEPSGPKSASRSRTCANRRGRRAGRWRI